MDEPLEEPTMIPSRQIWSSRTTFLLTAIGATVGFGSVWRFPAQVHGTIKEQFQNRGGRVLSNGWFGLLAHIQLTCSCCLLLLLFSSTEYGGGVFFFPCLLALFLIGIPLLVLELAVGQHIQNSDVASCGYLSKHFRGVGLATIVGGFCVVSYIVPLISWCIRILFGTLSSYPARSWSWGRVNQLAWMTFFV